MRLKQCPKTATAAAAAAVADAELQADAELAEAMAKRQMLQMRRFGSKAECVAQLREMAVCAAFERF